MKIRSGLLLGLCCLSWSLSAQRMAVQGTVVDSSGEPVIGANVIVRGSSAGVATDLDGRFRLDVVPDATLVVSYLGYNTQEVPVNNRSQITIVLQENAVALQEVVAIGYGTVRKSDATGSVTLVKPDEINAGLATSAQDLLVGKTPGVVVTLNGGKPEGGADIRIRGGSSLNATNDPLIVIDGVPVDNSGVTGMSNSLSMISPDNIESFTILKDASATAIYGSRASNGVIIITTKRGQSGKPQINFTANMYVNTPRNKVGVLDGDQFRQVITDYYGEGSPAYNLLGTANTNWQDEILRTSVSSDYNLSVGGTYKILPYRVAVSYTNQNGILKTSAMDRVTASITLNPKFFDNTLSVTANVKGFYMHNRFADEGAIGGAVSFDPSQSVRVDNLPIGNGYFTWLKPGTDEFIGIAPVNPVSLIDERSMKADVYRSVGNLQLDYVMPFLPALHANLNLGYDVSHSIQHNLMTPDSPLTYKENKKTGLGQDERLRQLKRNLLLDFYLNYKQDFESIHSRLDAMAGYSWQRFYKDGGTRTTLMPDKEQWFVSSYTDNPSITDLQNVADVSDAQNITKGNPNLNPSYSHRVNFHYTNSNVEKGRTFMWMFSMQNTSDYNANHLVSNPGTITLGGEQYTPNYYSTPVNLDGYWNLRTHLSYGFPIGFLKSNFNVMAGVNFTKTPSMLGGVVDSDGFITGGERNDTKNIGYDFRTVLGSNISENVDFTLSWAGTYNEATNSLGESGSKNRYFNHTAQGNMKFVFPLGFTFTGSVAYTQYIGFTNDYDDSYLLCNAWIGKKVFKNKRGEIMVGVNDIFNQNKAFARSTGSGWTQNSTNSVIGRYYMVQFTYNLRRFGKKGSKNIKDYDGVAQPSGSRRMGPGGPGGPPPGMFHGPR